MRPAPARCRTLVHSQNGGYRTWSARFARVAYREQAAPVRQRVRGFEQSAVLASIAVPSGPTAGPKWSHRPYLYETFGILPRPVIAGQRHDSDLLPAPL